MRYIVLVWFMMIGCGLFSQNRAFGYSVVYTTELQHNLANGEMNTPKWVNQAIATGHAPTDRFWKNGLFEASFQSVLSSTTRPILNDVLIFSNIDAPNYPFLCSMLGYEHKIKNVKVFAGIRNANIDYFESPYTSLFTNASAGIYPTIALNYAIANYPLAAMGIHADYQHKGWSVKNTFYNNLKGIDSTLVFKFQFNPQRYGYINISEVSYTLKNNTYTVGGVLNKTPGQILQYSVYSSIEQLVMTYNKTQFGLMGQLGVAPKSRYNRCYFYWAGGTVISNIFKDKNNDNFGVMVIHANLIDDVESCVEVTYLTRLTPNIQVQPTLHFVNNQNESALAGLMRVIISLNK